MTKKKCYLVIVRRKKLLSYVLHDSYRLPAHLCIINEKNITYITIMKLVDENTRNTFNQDINFNFFDQHLLEYSM